MKKRSCLIIASHLDDEILGCGGLISKSKELNIEAYVLVLTDGVETRYSQDMQKVLRENSLEANKVAGTKDIFFEALPNQQLDTVPLTTIIQAIEKYIDKVSPESIFTHHAGDLNKDHRITFEATMTAARPVSSQVVKRVYSYHVASSTEWNFMEGEDIFIPNLFVNITQEIDNKIMAMKCYASECRPYPHQRSPEAIKTYAHYWGLMVGMEYAEPYKLVRDVSGNVNI